MRLAPAPYFKDPKPLCPDTPPPDGQAFWIHTGDKRRCRLGLWRTKTPKGTIIIFPGRTEYIEKYASIAADFAARDYHTVAIDWRGQGLADRALPDRLKGHVADFAEYQQDRAPLIAAMTALALPKPWSLLAHSMGGCIGLRALHEGLPVQSVVFSGPMWGIEMRPLRRMGAWTVSALTHWLKSGALYAPGTSGAPYLLNVAFENNQLTNDRASFDHMKAQLQRNPSFGLGGPTLGWLNASLNEMHRLSKLPSPDLPCLTYLGSDEQIVDSRAIVRRMASWAQGRLITLPSTRHEALMEATALRLSRTDEITEFFTQNT